VAAGTPVTDSATLAGENASSGTGTVTYVVYSDAACSIAVHSGTAESITTAGTLPASSPVTLNAPGTYYWRATYSGDGLNGTSASTCGPAGEVETVTSAPTVTAVSPNSGPTTGGTPITITGTGFVSGASVKIAQGDGAGTGAISATDVDVVSSTKITATTGAGKAGAWNLFVITTGGTSAPNSGDTYTYQ
jgi:hypothetical protein